MIVTVDGENENAFARTAIPSAGAEVAGASDLLLLPPHATSGSSSSAATSRLK